MNKVSFDEWRKLVTPEMRKLAFEHYPNITTQVWNDLLKCHETKVICDKLPERVAFMEGLLYSTECNKLVVKLLEDYIDLWCVNEIYKQAYGDKVFGDVKK